MFSLRRNFLITSFLGVLSVVGGLLFFYRSQALSSLEEHEARSNVALTQVFANNIWPKYATFLTSANRMNRSELSLHREMAQLRADVLQQMQGLNVVKVKIYDVHGLTVFSTEAAQIGEDRSANPGFLRARGGSSASRITFKHSSSTFEQVITDRSIVESYIPIRKSDKAPVEGVLEVYSDVSDLVAQLNTRQWQIAGFVVGSLLLLYLFLFLIVRRAEMIMAAQTEEERLANREILRQHVSRDPLTGLPNRAKFTTRVDRVIKRTRKSGAMFAVLFVDLDNFKYINDSYGHYIGDSVLKEVAERLKECLNQNDIVARLGGDEFVILLPDISRIDYAAQVAGKICDAGSNRSYDIEGRQFRITVSVGISVYPDDGHDAAVLIKNADAAMYYAKEMGRNNYQFYTQDMNARAFAMLSIEHSLRQAVERNEFLLHYQPKVDIGSGRVVGMEALIRWQHPEMGLVSPLRFIPIAEERGLIVPIGDWALREACRQNRIWQDAGLPMMPVAVNVSSLQFRQQGFPEKVAGILAETGLAAEYLEIEITESVIMRGTETAIETVRRLKAHGVKLCIDDFGTGYSSLSYLKQFPVDRLKLDQSFVRGLPFDPDDLAISTAVIGMAKALKLKVVAEGVETKEQLGLLRSRSCDEAQGRYFCKPLPAEEFADFVSSSEPSRFDAAAGQIK